MNKHILIAGGMRYVHKRIKKIEGVRTTFVWFQDKVNVNDYALHERVLGLEENEDVWEKEINAIHQVDPFDGVLAFDDRIQRKIASVCQKVKIPFHSKKTIDLINDKYEMRKLLRMVNLDSTQSQIVNNRQDVVQFINKNGLPVFLKPYDGQGSVGVKKISTLDDIDKALTHSWNESCSSQLLVEEFLEGIEYSVESFSEDGIHQVVSITKKYKNQNFVEIGHQSPAHITQQERKLIKKFTEEFLTVIELQNGPSHTEIMVVKGVPHIIETHARLGGDFIPELVNYSTGIDLIDYSVRQILGKKVLKIIQRKMNELKNIPTATVWFQNENPNGEVTNIEDVASIESIQGVQSVQILCKVGEKIRPVQCSNDRIAAVISLDENPDHSLKIAQSSIQKIKIKVK